jgi:hypothetical protein
MRAGSAMLPPCFGPRPLASVTDRRNNIGCLEHFPVKEIRFTVDDAA